MAIMIGHKFPETYTTQILPKIKPSDAQSNADNTGTAI